MKDSTPSHSNISPLSTSWTRVGKIAFLAVAAVSASMPLAHATGLVIDTNALAITGSGVLNLKQGNLIVRNAGDTAHHADYLRIRNYVVSGYAAQAWTGAGINSSNAAADATAGNFLLAVGVLDNSFQNLSTFAGHTLSVTFDELLAKYTYYGDANLSGMVDDDDQGNLDFGRGFGVGEWYAGDFNYDGVVNDDDQANLDYGRGFQGPPLVSQGGGAGFGAVPEPSVVGLIAAGIIGLMNRRSKRGFAA